jgi:hypothetical protein
MNFKIERVIIYTVELLLSSSIDFLEVEDSGPNISNSAVHNAQFVY